MAALPREGFIYLVGATSSYAGTALVPIAMSFAVLDTGHGADGLGVVLAAQSIPTIILLLLGGVAGDRRSRRGIMIGSDLLRAATQTVLAGSLIYGHCSLMAMAVAAALIGVGNAFFQPSSSGFLTEIVAPEQLGRMNGLLTMGNAIAMVIGPALGGVVVAAIGPGWGIALDAASYVISATCLTLIAQRMKTPLAVKPRSIRGELAEGVRAVKQTRWLSLLLVQYAAINMLAFAPFNVIVPAFLSRTSAGAGEWGTVLAGIGVGAVLGAFACSRRQPRRLLLGVEAAATMLVCPMFLLALRAPLLLVVPGCVIFGIGAAMLSVLTMTAIQRQIARSLLSRTMAMVQLVNIGFNPVGYVFAGPVMSLLGAPLSLEVSGLCVLLSVALMLSRQEIRSFECQAA